MIRPDDPRSGKSPWQEARSNTSLPKTAGQHVRYGHNGKLQNIDQTKETQLIPRQRFHALTNIANGLGGTLELTGFGGIMLEATSHTFVDSLNQFFLAELVVGGFLVIGGIVSRNRR